MADTINGIKVPFIPIERPVDQPSKVNRQGTDPFKSVFEEELKKVKLSSHATKRLETRNISLSEVEMNRLQDAVKMAENKGAKDSLVMMDDTAFIVNIPNKTVVTALPIEKNGENVFTNIDSVVFAK